MAIRSMTGSGWARGSTSIGEVTVEVRSVNGRGLQVKTRFPGALQPFEREVERRVRARLSRGSVAVVAAVGRGGSALDAVLDVERFVATAARLEELAARCGLADVTIGDVLAVPGVLRTAQDLPEELGDALHADLADLLDTALDALIEEREVEGERTATAIASYLDGLDALRGEVEQRAPQVAADYRQRLLARVNEFLDDRGATLEDRDVVREVALFADRVDVSEELQRLRSHTARLRDTLEAGGEVGRGMEFLLQEVLREVNTIGSKSPDVAVSHAVVDMKSLVDKLKEQAANLE
ncbi:MAG: YicC family protein [Planctomycetes bacterium]|nr:YicC family protein [Planctomycetota bacterium]